MAFITSLLVSASPKTNLFGKNEGLLGKRVTDNNVTVKEGCFSNRRPYPTAVVELEQKTSLRVPLTTNF